MLKKGTVVLTPFPFTDLTGDKVRPAIIISEKLKGSDVVVLFMTTQKKLGLSHLVSVQPTVDNGLKAVSKVVCSKIATLDKKVIIGELGTLEKAPLIKISKELKTILNL